MILKIKFEPRDLWVGLYWTKHRLTTLETDVETVKFYICLLPCLPIILAFSKDIKPENRHINW